MLVPALDLRGLGTAKEHTRAMPTDLRRRDAIAAAIAAYNDADGGMLLLPPEAARLLTVMFTRDTVFRGNVDGLVAKGPDRRTVGLLLRALIDAGFLSKEPTRRGLASSYRLHLPPRAQP
jgi:hypothetical protein